MDELEVVFGILWAQNEEGLKKLLDVNAEQSDRLLMTPAAYAILMGETLQDEET